MSLVAIHHMSFPSKGLVMLALWILEASVAEDRPLGVSYMMKSPLCKPEKVSW